MIPEASDTDRTLLIALLSGCLYAAGILLWAFTTGVHFTTDDLASTAIGLGYASLGMFLVAAVPIYLLGRLSLVSPLLVAAWSLGNTAYLRWYDAGPHGPLAAYLTIWPFIVGIILVAAIVEFGIRIGTDRTVRRFGLRTLF